MRAYRNLSVADAIRLGGLLFTVRVVMDVHDEGLDSLVPALPAA